MTTGELIVVVILLGCAAALVWGLMEIVQRRGDRHRQRSVQRSHQANPAPQSAAVRPEAQQQRSVVLGPPRPVRLDPSQMRPPPEVRPPIRKGPPLAIQTRCAPLWKEKGWRRNGADYEGFYRAAGRAWRGLIQEPYPGRYQAFIWNPPLPQISRRTPHGPCFQNGQSDGRYQVHYHTAPRSLDHAITTIEDVLAEAFGQIRR